MDQCANNTASGKFTFSFSPSVSGRFANQAEHAANLVSRHDLSR
jgi:hypothetical protein